MNATVDAVAPSGVQLDAQQADRRAIAQLRRIIGTGQAAKLQHTGLGRISEARLALDNAGPGFTIGIHRAVQHERQLLIERTVLVRHLVAYHPATERVHSLGNPNVSLQLFLASMPRRTVHNGFSPAPSTQRERPLYRAASIRRLFAGR
ncbi:hypothetical protein D3C87_1271400 [compost metagenome]